MAAKDWAESEFPAASDPYPARRRVRRMGWYLKQPRHIQRFICGVWSCTSKRRVYLRVSTRGWRLEAAGLAAMAARDFVDEISSNELLAANNEEHQRRRARPEEIARGIAHAKAREYRAHRVARRADRRDVALLREQLAAALDDEERDFLREDLEGLLAHLRAGFSRGRLRFSTDGSLDRWA
jgi:hypothetical protein